MVFGLNLISVFRHLPGTSGTSGSSRVDQSYRCASAPVSHRIPVLGYPPQQPDHCILVRVQYSPPPEVCNSTPMAQSQPNFGWNKRDEPPL